MTALTAGPSAPEVEGSSPLPHEPWSCAAGDVANALSTDAERGLSRDEAQRRLVEFGRNDLVEKRARPAVLKFLQQFANTMILVLLGAAVVTVLVGETQDAVIIVAVVVLNAAIGYWQERRAEHAMAALKTMAAPEARVRRGGDVVIISAVDVVPGDVLQLEAGDVVAADGRLVDAAGLRINESALTGESVPTDKTTDVLLGDSHLVGDRHNMVFKGTEVSGGRGSAVVTATGMTTELGTIATLLEAHQAPQTPLQRRLAVLGRRLAFGAVAVCGVVFAAGVASGVPPARMLVTAVSLAVAAIPESLPAVVTISLALGAQRMSRQRAIIRKLPAVETLGSVTVIATDKTGTLTQGKMVAAEVWAAGTTFTVTGSGYEPDGHIWTEGNIVVADDHPELRRLLEAAVFCNDARLVPPSTHGGEWTVVGDPTEGALLSLAMKGGIDDSGARRRMRRLAELPFDSTRKRMTTVHAAVDGTVVISTKGAPESILPRVSGVARSTEDVNAAQPLTSAAVVAEAMAARGYRVLAIAGRT